MKSGTRLRGQRPENLGFLADQLAELHHAHERIEPQRVNLHGFALPGGDNPAVHYWHPSRSPVRPARPRATVHRRIDADAVTRATHMPVNHILE